MPNIAELNVILKATASPFVASIKQARAAAGGFIAQLTSVRGALAGLASAFGAYKLVGFVRQQMNAIDALNDLSARIGSSVGDIQRMRHALGVAGGVEAGTVDRALGKLTLTLGQAEAGSRRAQESFRALGLDYAQLAKVGAAEATLRIAAAMQQLAGPADRARVAVEIFGKAGLEIAPAFAAGSAELARLTAEAERLGLALSDVDAQKVSAANDAIERVGLAIQGVAGRFAVELSPFIEAASNKLLSFAVSGEGASTRVSKSLEWLATSVGVVGDVIQTVQIGWKYLQAAMDEGIAKIIEAIDFLGGVIDEMLSSIGVESEFRLGQHWVDGARESADEARQAFEAALIAPTYSERVAATFREIRADAAAAAKAAAAANAAANAAGAASGHWDDAAGKDAVAHGRWDAPARAAAERAPARRRLHAAKAKQRQPADPAAALERGGVSAYSAIVRASGFQRTRAEEIAKKHAETAKRSEKTLEKIERKLGPRPHVIAGLGI